MSSGALDHLFRRYLSIILIVVSNTGFFYHHFTPNTCSHYFYLAPVFKGTPLVPYTFFTSEVDKSSSLPGHGVASNPGYPVCLGCLVSNHRVRLLAAERITLLIEMSGWGVASFWRILSSLWSVIIAFHLTVFVLI